MISAQCSEPFARSRSWVLCGFLLGACGSEAQTEGDAEVGPADVLDTETEDVDGNSGDSGDSDENSSEDVEVDADVEECAPCVARCEGIDIVYCDDPGDGGCVVERRTSCGEAGFCVMGETSVCAQRTCSSECTIGEHSCSNGRQELRQCVAGVDGCGRWETENCQRSGLECTEFGYCGTRSPVTALCEGRDTCPVAGASCDGQTLVWCVADANGCLTEQRVDCGRDADGFCSAAAGACGVSPGLECDAEACAVGEKRCADGDVATCVTDWRGCGTWEVRDCGDSECTGDGAEATCADVCAGKPLCPLPFEGVGLCLANHAVRCETDGEGCYVETFRQNCSATGEVCNNLGERAFCHDPCVGQILCDAEDPELRCEDNKVLRCSVDPLGCLAQQILQDCNDFGELCEIADGEGICVSDGECPPVAAVLGCGESFTFFPDEGASDRIPGVCEEYPTFGPETVFMIETPWEVRTELALTSIGPAPEDYQYVGALYLDPEDGCLGGACDRRVGVSNLEVPIYFYNIDERARLVFEAIVERDEVLATPHELRLSVECLEALDVCGDGVVIGSLGCDDGNRLDGDGCSARCELEPGVIAPCPMPDGTLCMVEFGDCSGMSSETCDFHVLECGDGKIDGIYGEFCDDGNARSGDGCSAECKIEPSYTCEGLPSVCSFQECGNSQLDGDESCDDGNTNNGDGCTDRCYWEIPATGELLLAAEAWPVWEGCEETYRGQWVHNPSSERRKVLLAANDPEQRGANPMLAEAEKLLASVYGLCPGDSQALPSGFSGPLSLLRLETKYSHRIETFEPGERKWAMFHEGVEWIRARPLFCGDGLQYGTEECDDGGQENGDGCSADCSLEPGFHCSGNWMSRCEPGVCGDGELTLGESCDDGNLLSLDGCSPDCRIEIGLWHSAVFFHAVYPDDPFAVNWRDATLNCQDTRSAARTGYSAIELVNVSSETVFVNTVQLTTNFSVTWAGDRESESPVFACEYGDFGRILVPDGVERILMRHDNIVAGPGQLKVVTYPDRPGGGE